MSLPTYSIKNAKTSFDCSCSQLLSTLNHTLAPALFGSFVILNKEASIPFFGNPTFFQLFKCVYAVSKVEEVDTAWRYQFHNHGFLNTGVGRHRARRRAVRSIIIVSFDIDERSLRLLAQYKIDSGHGDAGSWDVNLFKFEIAEIERCNS